MKLVIRSQKTRILNSDQKLSDSDFSVYEVIRVIRCVPLFLEEHYFRLKNTLEFYHIQPELDFHEFQGKIDELIRKNSKSEGNIRIERVSSVNEIQWVFDFIQHNYPTQNDYLNGVKTDLFYAERSNPNAKVIQGTLRDRVNQHITNQKLFEVLLVDQQDKITEGSRSNVFFVQANVVYTAPASEVLIGITRQKVIKCLNEMNFQVKEIAVSANEIGNYDAVFLSGTSPKVIPVRSIGNVEFKTQLPLMKEIIIHYNQMIDSYIRANLPNESC